MAIIKPGFFNYPLPSKEQGQRSINVDDLFLTRFTPPWSRPASLPANVWRAWVLNQPVAVVCRETLIANLLALDWKITPRNSKYREELEPVIRHYTKLIERGGEYGALGLDYSGITEWITGDVLDTPFGGAAEVGRKGDSPEGRVVWIRPLDAGTLYPTLNEDFPIVQYYMQYEAVAFPYWTVSRTFMSPHSSLWREGWGMAPPEKIYFALELLNRGDKYYANLLLDVPTAGILDLGDMAKEEAFEWSAAFKSFVNDTNVSFRVPVLYEHNSPVNFISLGKVPNDIMFDHITLKYAALVAAAYGMSLSDIGLQTTSASGETLAGSIRQERRTRKTGFARVKAKMKSFWNRILPETLEFNYVDYDDELNVGLGRARLASSQAFLTFKDMGVVSPQEIRSQAISDGLFSISLPDEIPPEAEEKVDGGGNGEPELIGDKKAPSAGGEGEVKSLTYEFKPKTKIIGSMTKAIVDELAPRIIELAQSVGEDEFEISKSAVTDALFSEDDVLGVGKILDGIMSKSIGVFKFGKNVDEEIKSLLSDDFNDVNIRSYIDALEKNIKDGLGDFIGRAILFVLNDVVFNQEVVDKGYAESYDYIMQQIGLKIETSLSEFIKAHVSMETERIVNKLKLEN